MNLGKKEATRLAKELFGPTAQAIRRSSNDRRLRHVIAVVEPGGVYGREKLYVVSSGRSFYDALELAKGSDFGKQLISSWKSTQEQFEEFKKNPAEFTKKMSEALDKYKQQVEETLHGRRYEEGSEGEVRGQSGEGAEDGPKPEEQ